MEGSSTNSNPQPTNNSNAQRPQQGMGGYGMNMGGMGRGMGMGGMGMGYGFRPGMGMGMGMGGFMDPFMNSVQWLHSLNYLVYTIGHMAELLGMNANAILQGYQTVKNMIKHIIDIIKQSDTRIWLKNKSKKSKLLRFLFVFVTMATTALIIQLIQYIHAYYQLCHGSPNDSAPKLLTSFT